MFGVGGAKHRVWGRILKNFHNKCEKFVTDATSEDERKVVFGRVGKGYELLNKFNLSERYTSKNDGTGGITACLDAATQQLHRSTEGNNIMKAWGDYRVQFLDKARFVPSQAIQIDHSQRRPF